MYLFAPVLPFVICLLNVDSEGRAASRQVYKSGAICFPSSQIVDHWKLFRVSELGLPWMEENLAALRRDVTRVTSFLTSMKATSRKAALADSELLMRILKH